MRLAICLFVVVMSFVGLFGWLVGWLSRWRYGHNDRLHRLRNDFFIFFSSFFIFPYFISVAGRKLLEIWSDKTRFKAVNHHFKESFHVSNHPFQNCNLPSMPLVRQSPQTIAK